MHNLFSFGAFLPNFFFTKQKILRFDFRMQQYPAMDSIRNIVDSRYHRLILSGQPDLCALMSNQSLSGRRNTGKLHVKL